MTAGRDKLDINKDWARIDEVVVLGHMTLAQYHSARLQAAHVKIIIVIIDALLDTPTCWYNFMLVQFSELVALFYIKNS